LDILFPFPTPDQRCVEITWNGIVAEHSPQSNLGARIHDFRQSRFRSQYYTREIIHFHLVGRQLLGGGGFVIAPFGFGFQFGA
jgi:hypothetical protein